MVSQLLLVDDMFIFCKDSCDEMAYISGLKLLLL